MALHTADPPIPAYEAVRSLLTRLAAEAGFRTPNLRRTPAASLALSTPHRFAVLPLDRLRRGGALQSIAEVKGWRFLLHDGKRVIAAADAQLTPKGDYQFGQINEGPFTVATEEAIRRAEADKELGKGRFEPVLLLVPALYVVALWLQDLDGKHDRVMVMPPAPGDLAPYRPLPAEEFMAVLKKLAAAVPPEAPKGKSPSGG